MAENRENRRDIYCPFRVLRKEHPPMLRGNGTTTTEEFYPCMGTKCAAFYQGACLRLMPPALVCECGPLTDADVEIFQREMRNAPVFSVPEEPPEPWQDCHNCENYETKDGCDDCISSVDENGRRNTIPSNWRKGVPW